LAPVAITCATVPAAPAPSPTTKEKPTLPTINAARFAGDPNIATFAKALATCHAARIVDDEIQKRYLADVAAAKKRAETEAQADTEKAISTAVAGLDQADRKGAAAAKKAAAAAAKKAAAQKIAAAGAAVLHQQAAVVQAELAQRFEDELAADFSTTMDAAIGRFGPGWLAHMTAKLNATKSGFVKQMTKAPPRSNAQPAPAVPSKEEIAAEIEAKMIRVRCDQDEWVANQIVRVEQGWMFGRREQVDFDTVHQAVAELKDFGPTRSVAPGDLKDIPAGIAADSSPMPGLAPELVDLLGELAKLEPNFKAGNYAGHGGGTWAGAGFSVDLTLSGKDSALDARGFWMHDAAVRFLLHIDAAAKAAGARWRALYNDFSVAEEVNRATGVRNVTFTGNAPKNKLNWHGPAPMVLHFHLDFEIPQKPAPANQPASPGATPPG